MKRKTNKKSGIIAAVVGLSAVSLVSVGFASWVMSSPDEASLTGQISVETVDDQRFLIAKGETYGPKINYGTNKHVISNVNDEPVYEQANSICFGIDDTDEDIDDPWLTASTSGALYENLDATLTFYVANLTTEEKHENVVKAVLSVNDNASNGWATASSSPKKYVAAAPGTDADTGLTYVRTDDIEVIDNVTYRKVTADIKFGWGDYFKINGQGTPVNPYTYFNTMDDTIANGNEASRVLNELATYLNKVSFTITITTTVPNNA